MNRLLVALIGSAFASALALAQSPSTQPVPTTGPGLLSKMSTEEAKKARAEAKAKWAKMTPEEKAAAKKAAQAKHQDELTAIDELVIKGEGAQYNAKQGAELAKESKAQAKPTKAERQADLKKAEDASAKTGVSKSGVPQQ